MIKQLLSVVALTLMCGHVSAHDPNRGEFHSHSTVLYGLPHTCEKPPLYTSFLGEFAATKGSFCLNTGDNTVDCAGVNLNTVPVVVRFHGIITPLWVAVTSDYPKPPAYHSLVEGTYTVNLVRCDLGDPPFVARRPKPRPQRSPNTLVGYASVFP